MAYVCEQLETTRNIYGGFDCKNWVIYDSQTWVDVLAITPSQMVWIGGSICGVFAIITAYSIVAKALNTM